MPFQGGDYNRLVRNITAGDFIQPREQSGKNNGVLLARRVRQMNERCAIARHESCRLFSRALHYRDDLIYRFVRQ
jgi:hypothetical protein